MISGNLFIIASPSGGGKTTLCNLMLQKINNISASISFTTRLKRPNEIEGKDYYFVNKNEFSKMVDSGSLLENATVYGNNYGTSKKWVEKTLLSGTDVILDIDWQGARKVKKTMEHCTSVFILPISKDILYERLSKRGLDSNNIIANRMKQVQEHISECENFDYIIVNDDLNTSVDQLCSIISSKRLIAPKQYSKYNKLISKLLE